MQFGLWLSLLSVPLPATYLPTYLTKGHTYLWTAFICKDALWLGPIASLCGLHLGDLHRATTLGRFHWLVKPCLISGARRRTDRRSQTRRPKRDKRGQAPPGRRTGRDQNITATNLPLITAHLATYPSTPRTPLTTTSDHLSANLTTTNREHPRHT
ncbi:hypothetical protein VTJ04DRAFT_6108 [Mycothermus thermophilus]|uniref:uncharacterized protein n=1 Tax=Humicola insolens TaxID=85995 RepID=UPI0037446BC7